MLQKKALKNKNKRQATIAETIFVTLLFDIENLFRLYVCITE